VTAVFELIVCVLFIVLPFGLGVLTRSYVSALPWLALFIFALAQLLAYKPGNDEVDVIPWIFMVASGLAVLVDLAGAAIGRRLRRVADSAD
jgi:hypothetical protein